MFSSSLEIMHCRRYCAPRYVFDIMNAFSSYLLYYIIPCPLCLYCTLAHPSKSSSLDFPPQDLGAFSRTVNTMTWYLLCSQSLLSPPRSLFLSTFPHCSMCRARLELAFGSPSSQVWFSQCLLSFVRVLRFDQVEANMRLTQCADLSRATEEL